MKAFFTYLLVNVFFSPVYIGFLVVLIWALGIASGDAQGVSLILQILSYVLFIIVILIIPNLITYVIIKKKYAFTHNLLFFIIFNSILALLAILLSISVIFEKV